MKAELNPHGSVAGERTVRVSFQGTQAVNFTAMRNGTIICHYYSGGPERLGCVGTNEVNKDACRVTCSLYTVSKDDPDGLTAYVDVADPAMTTIREILSLAHPEEKAKELLAAAYFNSSWPSEFKNTLKQWMQADDEAESDAVVPISNPDASDLSQPPTALMS